MGRDAWLGGWMDGWPDSSSQGVEPSHVPEQPSPYDAVLLISAMVAGWRQTGGWHTWGDRLADRSSRLDEAPKVLTTLRTRTNPSRRLSSS